MGIFSKVKEAVKPKDINLQIAETRQKLTLLEGEYTVYIRKERNAVANAKSKAAKTSAEERLRNAYISLRLVHIAQERLYDVSSTYELTKSIKDLNKSIAVLNRLDKKTDVSSPSLFLNYRSKKMMNRKGQAESGGMKQYYDGSMEEVLMSESAMNKLMNTNLSLKSILKEDEETQENLDDFMDFVEKPDIDLGDIEISDDLDDLINNLG